MLCSLLEDQAEAPSPAEPPERSRPYAVLRGQNLGEQRGLVGGGVAPALLLLGATDANAQGERWGRRRAGGAAATHSPKSGGDGLSCTASARRGTQ